MWHKKKQQYKHGVIPPRTEEEERSQTPTHLCMHTRTLNSATPPFTTAALSMCSDSDESFSPPSPLTQSPALPCLSCNWLVTGLSSATLHQADFNQPR